MKSKLLLFLIAALYFSGCNTELKNSSATTDNSETRINRNAADTANQINTGANTPIANNSAAETGSSDGAPLILSGTGEVKIIPCNGREIEIEEAATANTYTFTGECKKLKVDGVSNKIRVDRVGEISVIGISNSVVYGEGLKNQKPKIQKSGKDTSVETVKENEAKKAAEKKQVS